MSCDRRLLSSLRDAQVSPVERDLVERHLTECADCRAEYQRMIRVGQAVRSLAWQSVPASVGQNVRRAIAEREAARRQPIRVGGYARAFAPAAACASVALAVVLVLRSGADDPTLRFPSPAGETVEVGTGETAPLAAPGAQSGAPTQPAASGTTGQPAPAAQVAPPPGSAPAPAAATGTQERPGNRISDAGREAAPTTVASALPDRTRAESAPEVPSLATALAAQEPAPSMPAPISRLYGARGQLRDQLGEPLRGSRTVTLLEQSFQGGLAVWRSDTREIYVMRREGGSWSTYQDRTPGRPRSGGEGSPPPGALVPAGDFGELWSARPEVKSRLGWAVYEPRGSGGVVQAFERGVVVWTPHGLLYVLTEDGHWRTYADARPV